MFEGEKIYGSRVFRGKDLDLVAVEGVSSVENGSGSLCVSESDRGHGSVISVLRVCEGFFFWVRTVGACEFEGSVYCEIG